jgi:hypothetical protein
VAHEEIDLDRDGQTDVLVATPALEAGFSPSGGAMFELSYKPAMLTLMDLPARRPEAMHERLRGPGVAEPGGRKPENAPPLTPLEVELEPRLRYDRYFRASFLDHFLGADATPENFYQCRYPEAGDFLDGDYELSRVSYDRRAGAGLVHLSRNGHVTEVNAPHRSPVRVEKLFTFDDRDGRVRVRYALTNRGHEPVEFRFGPELVFGWPLELAGISPAAGVADEAGLTPDGLEPFPRGSDGVVIRGAALERERVGLSVPGTGLRVVVAVAMPASWWWFPQETLIEQDGTPVVQVQGVVLLPHWTVSLWGEETRTIDLEIEVSEPVEAPTAVIEEDDEP